MTERKLIEEVARAGRRPGAARTLLLDLDGTLAPLAPTPEAARVPPETLEALDTLAAQSWTVAVVSGRGVEEVRRMIPLRSVRAFGSHGLEGSWTGRARTGLPAPLRRRWTALGRRAAALVARSPGVRLERKPAGLAFHDRGLPRKEHREWQERLSGWLDRQDLEGFEVIRGKRVVELRPRGFDKGSVIRSMPGRKSRSRRDSSLVAIGDDRTDEDMFRELRDSGLGIRVGRSLRGSLARRLLPSTTAVRRFLQELVESS